MRGSSPRMTPSMLQRSKDGGSELRRRRAHEIALADLDAALANDVVGGGGVEIEVRQAAAEQQALPGEVHDVAVRRGELDLLGVGAVNVALADGLQKRDGLADALLELGQGGFLGAEL